MVNKSLNAALSSSVLFLITMHPTSLLAQSIDDCMSANHTEALTLCKNILDSGSRNADVYWKLSSALYQDGQLATAATTLADALRLHPGNAKLLKLQDIISSSATEQEMLELAAQLNQRSFDQGALKISCLTKSGVEGITACKRRLELTDDDGDNMRARLNELESQQEPTTVATSPTDQLPPDDSAAQTEANDLTEAGDLTASNDQIPPVDENPTDSEDATDSVVEIEDITAATETVDTDSDNAQQIAAEERKVAYKNLVTQVQVLLNELGFPTGAPDGFPGEKTRNALSEFYTVLDAPASKSIDESTLEELILQKDKLANANQLVNQSEVALARNNIELAQIKLADAKDSSQLLKVPEALERDLKESQLENLASNTNVTPVVTEPTFGEPAILDTQSDSPSTTTKIDNAPAEQFVDLMNQINTLRGQIKRVEEDQIRRLEQVRNIM